MRRVANGEIGADGEAGNRAASSGSAASSAASRAAWHCRARRGRRRQKITGSVPSAACSPSRARSASEKPIMTSATRPPWPSTSALVASVVDMETSLMAAGATAGLGQHRIDRAAICRRRGHAAWSAPWPWRRRPPRLRPQHGVGIGAAGIDAEEERAGDGVLLGWHSRNGPQERGRNCFAPLSRSRPDMKAEAAGPGLCLSSPRSTGRGWPRRPGEGQRWS